MSGVVSFLDSNVWLYAITTQPGAEDKRQVALELLRRPDKVISTQVINEVCVNAIKKGGATERQVAGLVQSMYRQCKVVMLERSTLLSASALRQRYGFSFWDGLIVATALAGNAAILYSEDMQDGLVLSAGLSIVNPFKQRR